MAGTSCAGFHEHGPTPGFCLALISLFPEHGPTPLRSVGAHCPISLFPEHGAPQAKYPPISHADGHQYYAVDSRTKGVLETMAAQASAGGGHLGRARAAG